MADPKITDIRAASKKRSDTITAAQKGLLERTTSLEKRMYSFVVNSFLPEMDINKGKVVNSTKNLKLINTSDGLKKFFKEAINIALKDYYQEQFKSITAKTGRIYEQFSPNATSKKAVEERGKLMVEGLLDSIFGNTTVQTGIQTTLRNSVIAGQQTNVLKQLLESQIQGKEGKYGSLTHFHYGNGYDQMQSYSRSLDNDYSTVLSLNYAIYQGGEIKTTRQFCEERAGKVFNRETVLSWQNEEWTGKIPNGDILIDLGGYNCRHDLDWISYELAKRIDPTIEKSTFDK